MNTVEVGVDSGSAAALATIAEATTSGTRWNAEAFQALLQQPGSIVFADECIRLGFIIVRRAVDEAEILNLVVVSIASDARVLGVGCLMLPRLGPWRAVLRPCFWKLPQTMLRHVRSTHRPDMLKSVCGANIICGRKDRARMLSF